MAFRYGVTSAVAITSMLISTVCAVPSPASLSSDISILTHNDLYGPSSPRQQAFLVLHTPQSYVNAAKSCSSLSETLWNPSTGHNSTQNLKFLRYLDYGKDTDDLGTYWIDNQKSGNLTAAACQTIDTHGTIRKEEDCNLQYPALCSQSAELSSPSHGDTSAKWQVAVKTGNASVTGYRDKLSFRFLGLKYGTIPARFEYSTYAAPRANVSALAYGLACIQSGCTAEPNCSEDCLSLNIWTPYLPSSRNSQGKEAETKKKGKAVMVWIHGGGYSNGQGSDTTFDGGNLASRGDVVVITLNYRLSTLGFLALSNTPLKGNYGIADPITALDWIRAHVEDFGGDKDRITVFGQSAGSASVRALLASEKASGKFAGAIMQSNPGGLQYVEPFSKYMSIGEATERAKALMNETGCQRGEADVQLACLRAQDASKLVGATAVRYPVIDGFYLTSGGLPLSGSAPKTNVSLMIGSMRDDGSPFSKFSSSSNASQALKEQGFDAAKILGSKEFPLPQSGNVTKDIFNLTSRVATDAMFRCSGQATAMAGTKNGIFPVVYAYEIDRGYQISEWSPNFPACETPNTAERPFGDTRLPYMRCHSGELYSVFGTLVRQGRQPRDEDDIPFSQLLVDTWSAFAREKDPSPDPAFLSARDYTNTSATLERATQWKPLDLRKPGIRVLNVEPKDESLREVEQCAILGIPLNYYSN